MDGYEVEKNVYSKLKTALRNAKNTLVLSGWNNKNAKDNNSHLEADFIIISEHQRLIISIEVKKTFSKENLEQSKEQIKKQLNLLQNHIPFPEKECWHHAGFTYFDVDEEPDNTIPNTLWKNTDMESWWRNWWLPYFKHSMIYEIGRAHV